MTKLILVYFFVLNSFVFSMVEVKRGIEINAPEKILDEKQRDQLISIITHNPAGLALDETLFLNGKHLKQPLTKLNYINAEILDSFLHDFARYINALGIDLFITAADIERVFSDIVQNYPGHITSFKSYQKYKENYAKSFFEPIKFIQECQCFSRRLHNFRDVVESRVLDYLNRYYPDKNAEIVLTELGSGGLFQLLVMATKIIQNGYQKLRINCIDFEYETLLKYLNAVPGEPITFSRDFPWSKKEASELVKLFVNVTAKKATRIDYSKIQSLLDDYRIYQTFKQFIQWLDNLTDSAQCVMYVDLQKYIQDCDQDSSLKSDILLAIDYYPDQNYPFWDLLRQNALKQMGIAYSVYEIGATAYLSEGSFGKLFHYEFYKTEEEKSEGKKAPAAPYQLKRVKQIPKHVKAQQATTRLLRKEYVAAIGEIVS